jgi:hypothetical protein
MRYGADPAELLSFWGNPDVIPTAFILLGPHFKTMCYVLNRIDWSEVPNEGRVRRDQFITHVCGCTVPAACCARAAVGDAVATLSQSEVFRR